VEPLTYSFWLSFLYLILALLCAFQCSRIIYYKHKLFSYQFGFLSLCLVFALLRFALFMFLCALNYSIGYDILYWIPFYIQFATFSLLVLFFARILEQNQKAGGKGKRMIGLFVASNGFFFFFVFVFLILSGIFHDYECDKIACCACSERCCPHDCDDTCGSWFRGDYLYDNVTTWCGYYEEKWYPFEPDDMSSAGYQDDVCQEDSSSRSVYDSHCACQGDIDDNRTYHISTGCCQPIWLQGVSAFFAGTIFLALNIFLGYYGIRIVQAMRQNTNFQVPFQTKGASPKRIIVITVIICIIFLSRSIFDFAVIAGLILFDASTGRLTDEIANILLYTFWEIVPTMSIIFLFWKIPKTDVGLLSRAGPSVATNLGPSNKRSASKPLFHDRRRYDSDEDEGASLMRNNNESTLYGTPNYPYLSSTVTESVQIKGHSPYPISSEAANSYEITKYNDDEEENVRIESSSFSE